MNSLHGRALLAAVAVLAATAVSFAQPRYPSEQRNTPALGAAQTCMNSAGVFVPCPLADTQPEITAPNTAATRQQRARIITISPNSGGPGQYPTGAIPITGNSTGSTGAVIGTLAARPGARTYICGFDVSAIGGTAAVGPITVAGLTGSSMVYEMSSTAAGVTFQRTYTPCIPASANNTAITITTTADGTATAVDVNSWGFQQ